MEDGSKGGVESFLNDGGVNAVDLQFCKEGTSPLMQGVSNNII
jgi:hypothetical protein